ncbi:sulfatase-like hydrolase/transferase [Alienimonas californiensis]|uniref:Arylsulfatase n=1 Tax=Alienimonas californiensis TaxID=2527989 RepID=A0A517PF05_9PLAN|nr:sulfatase-like hydrolase/transferase [Alienimonas californiensis]QDT17944.1 Arylsulfatase [Alienimonas californiensis]
MFASLLLSAAVLAAGPADDAGAVPDGASPAERPNVLLILADDLGVEALGCYGGVSYETPNLDRLAAGGRRFEFCFSNPLCSPSRAELLTGREPLHNGIRRVIYDPKNHREFLDPAREQSVGNLFRDAGYATAAAGKWQLSFLTERDTPAGLGFERSQFWPIQIDGARTSRYAEPSFWGDRPDGTRGGWSVPGGYGPDGYNAFVRGQIDRAQAAGQPFFIYYAMLLPHFPWEPTPGSEDPLKRTASLASSDHGDMKYFPDMVAYMDRLVGRTLDHLERTGALENTVVVFLGDNGCQQGIISERRIDGPHGPRTVTVNGGKGTLTDAGTHVPLIISWPGTIPAGVDDGLVEFSDVLPTLADLCDLPTPRNPINGVSFADRLGVPGMPERPDRDWVHIQDKAQRQVRSRTHMLNERGQFRPVVPPGSKPAPPLSEPLSPELQAERDRLAAALKAVETFDGP